MKFNCIAIEDERIIQMLIKRIFKRKMADKIELLGIADNAHDGEELIKQHRNELDILFLDVILPDKSGFELLEELDIPDDVQIIMMTGDDQIKERAYSHNLTDIIIKPFDVKRIQEALQKAEDYIESKESE